MTFYIVDVFAEARYQGNQLCVFTGAAGLTDAQMGRLAREINFPETTFVTGGSLETGIDVRIFTPEYEVPFAGHPTLGTAYVLLHHVFNAPRTAITLNLVAGPVRVESLGETLWLTAPQPRFGPTFDLNSTAHLFQLPDAALDAARPIEWVSTGLPYLIIPLPSLDAMRAVRPQADACLTWLLRHHLHKTNSTDGLTTAFYFFCPETYSPANQLNARMFCLENDAIVEDPATGSAASCLLACLLKNRFSEHSTLRLRVEQGYERHRPSLLELEGRLLPAGDFSLRVGGQVQFVAKGEWHT